MYFNSKMHEYINLLLLLTHVKKKLLSCIATCGTSPSSYIRFYYRKLNLAWLEKYGSKRQMQSAPYSGHCQSIHQKATDQELVNLLLTGKAVSNDVVELDSGNGNITILKGVSGRSDIGLLSLFEHYSICKVESFLKTPKFPVWVVCSESHFSVLFCLKKELMSDWKFERRFDLYYYDGLANQQDEIQLSNRYGRSREN
ncbi:probable ubiquitin carboxyl-terminal hydrolase MINDY-4 [Heterodontus francisci]|uniref:probable ubiquitin carboxyl-terminal hydrolase MINDY-4 n=1 Tax=Heterodontus francisci TaxID=7792 RepID=UPI00355B3DB4